MKRLFYFTGYRLIVSHWKGKKLIGSNSFEPTETGLSQFRGYLLQTENIISQFLVDVIEEDFRNEKIPHVSSKDRSSVVARLVDRYYRSSQDYCYSEIIGREKSGRKDDVVLLGAMTNPQLIQPWLTILDECGTALSGIWTLPIISKKLLKTIKSSSGVVLLVSQQVSSNIRQTLFRDGKLISSRQSIINQEITDISGIGKRAAPEVDRTIDFLRAQNLIDANEVIHLHILGSDEQILSLQNSFKSNDHQIVNIHSIAELHSKLGLIDAGEKFSDGIFSWLCLNQSVASTHYGPRQSFRRYHNKLAAMALYAASLLVVIFGVLVIESNISSAMEYEKSITLLKQQEKNYKELYQKKFKEFEEVFQNASLMNSAVSLAERIKRNGMTSPLDFLITLSNILSQPGVGKVYIDKIEWQAININERNNKEDQANFTAKLPVKHGALITGRIVESENNYRESGDRIQAISNYLKTNPRIESVETLKLPVDMRSDSRFSTEAGVDTLQRRNRELSGIFTLKVIMKAHDHA
ncbi:MAG: bifunctional adenosylcobinamide kinase/adenosylcobinamide-phosphate guanylyltransferase [Gammaproteobacteria bacterium]|nr:bifunctional adenosylcobinamide kinase/adenosylcobinamide-phosphate guanylyltransferase [Gammaproteobacteria bacterium]